MKNIVQDANVNSQSLARSRRLWTAFILGSLAAFGPLSIDMYLPALPMITKDLHTSTSLTQLSLTFFLLGLSLGQLLVGPLSDIRGRRTPLLVGVMIYGISSLLCALSPSIWVLIILRFIQGLSGAAGIVISRAIARDLYSGTELTKFFALLMLINGAAPILSPIVGAQLLKMTSWVGVFIILSAIGVFLFLAVFFGLPETLPIQNRSKGGIKNTLLTFRKLINDRLFIGYALSQGLVMAGMFAYISGSPFVIQNVFKASPQMFSLFFAINGIGIVIASQVTGKLAGRIKESRLLIIGLTLAAIGSITLLAMILVGAGLYAILLPLFIVVSSVGIVSTTTASLAMQNQGQSAGSASALLGVLSFIFGGLVAPLVGLGGSDKAVPMGMVIAAADIAALLCYFIFIHRKAKA
ncbi:multidrug effflux MFS transporter [Thermoflavimicrobium daqui]|uniref:Bcr/CflA family efflux transporter n=1 Tax=Thermoflavimicrobium daqui TaxID=2137476 RepID=A0A364K4F8_9BACL|nr:multidrug effflux MFS transporter [Thermoflavimicrobium daqui]RAL24149.1 MFS transporter [Thermoflavimicrobium daqui]